MILLILANVFVYLDLQGGDTEVEMEGALGRGFSWSPTWWRGLALPRQD